MNDQDSRHRDEDLIALIEAVKAAKLPEPPRPVNTGTTPLLLQVPTPLVDQFTEWRTQAARQLHRDDVSDTEVLRVLLGMLIADNDLTARVVDALCRESGS